MTAISNDLVKQLREQTGVGILDCRKALTESSGDLEKAKLLLREWGKADLASRAAAGSEGRIESYIHHNGKVGVLVEVNTQTDFAANGPDIREFLKSLAMHIAAVTPAPICVKPEDLSAEILSQEKELYRKQAEQEGKPATIIDKIVEGKLQSYYAQVCLVKQAFIKDPTGKTKIEDVLGDLASKTGEVISIKRFARFEIGK
jgi:elongation factor Ts